MPAWVAPLRRCHFKILRFAVYACDRRLWNYSRACVEGAGKHAGVQQAWMDAPDVVPKLPAVIEVGADFAMLFGLRHHFNADSKVLVERIGLTTHALVGFCAVGSSEAPDQFVIALNAFLGD